MHVQSRRALLSAGAGISGVSLLALTGRGFASSSSDSTTTTAPAAPTTTSPPRRPTDADVNLLGAAQQVELTARGLYDEAINAGGWDESGQTLTVITTIREAHEAAAQSLAGLLGNDAPGEMASQLFTSLRNDFRGGVSARLEAMYRLESAIVATHTEVLGGLVGIDGAALIAAIQSAEARHGVALADLNGQTVVSTLLVATEEPALVIS